jgi:hypothetical protein
VKDHVEILGGIGPGHAYFDPLAFKPVTEARFGTAPWGAVRGPGYANWDFGLFRAIRMPHNSDLQIRLRRSTCSTRRISTTRAATCRTCSSTRRHRPHLNGFAEVTSTYGERQMRLACGSVGRTGAEYKGAVHTRNEVTEKYFFSASSFALFFVSVPPFPR